MTMPKRGTTEYHWWRQGALDEAKAQTEGMTKEGESAHDYVQALAQQGASADRIATLVACVFTVDWSWRDRLRLAWKLVRR
jgi:hypothetical protein